MNFRRSVKSLLAVICSATLGSAFADRFNTTGAVVTQVDDAEVYAWTSTNEVGTIVVPDGGALFDILLVGGGGAGGFCRGGGGGGGGVLYQTGVFLEAGTYYVKVGAGGEPDLWSSGSYDAPASTEKTDGRPSTLSNATEQVKIAYGGGGGASFKGGVGRAGGSSGGCANKNTVAPEGVVGQGNRGGATHVTSDYYSAGGGGGGGPGAAATDSSAGSGGDGYFCTISGTNAWYGAGGGGGANNGNKGSGAGGLGGGGHGGYGTNIDLTSGADGVGAGGGGASGTGNKWSNCGGKRGGNGIVIIRTAAASKPDFTSVQVVVSDATNITFSAALSGMGTDPQGTTSASGCDLYLAYGTDSNNLVSVKVKTGWTLADSQWSMTVHDIPKYSKFYWRAALTNDFDVGAETVQSGVNMTVGFGAALPVKCRFSDPTQDVWAGSGWIGYYALPALIDGSVTIRCNLNRTISPNVLFDVGEAKSIGLVRFHYGEDTASITNTLRNFELYGSNDCETWTKLSDMNNFMSGYKFQEWMEGAVDSHTPYRYLEMRGVVDAKLGEIEFISEEMSLKSDKPTYYPTSGTVEALNVADDPDGVKISGTLVKSSSAATEIYGYYADTDYDNNESDWRTHGTKFRLDGTYATGGTFSQKIKIRGRGRFFLRLFAKAGEQVTSSQRSWEVGLKSSANIVPMYSMSVDMSKLYDGDITTSHDGSAASPWVYFDLRGLGKNETLSHLRFWPVVGSYNKFTWSRTHCGKIYVSYDDAEVTPTGSTVVEGREVYQIASELSVNWTLLKPYLDDMEVIFSSTECVYLGIPKGMRPTFLKVGNFNMNNCREIELRTIRPPKGMTIIFR